MIWGRNVLIDKGSGRLEGSDLLLLVQENTGTFLAKT